MLCAIWYHFYNLKDVKNTHGGVLLLVKSQGVFFTFLKLYKWYQITQSRTNEMQYWAEMVNKEYHLMCSKITINGIKINLFIKKTSIVKHILESP